MDLELLFKSVQVQLENAPNFRGYNLKHTVSFHLEPEVWNNQQTLIRGPQIPTGRTELFSLF